jgi:hypothetical protein
VVITSVSSSGDWFLSELFELFEGVVLEHGGVGKESVVRGHLFKFDHRNLTGLMESSELVFEECDSIHGFIVLSDSEHEDVRSFASLVLEGLDEGINGIKPSSDPLEIGGGVCDLRLDELSVGDGGVVDTAVGVGDTLKVRDGSGEIVF